MQAKGARGVDWCSGNTVSGEIRAGAGRTETCKGQAVLEMRLCDA